MALTRRRLLGGLLAGAAGAGVASALPLAAATADEPAAGDTLVILSFRGGLDGLSAIVPGFDAGYYAIRPNIGVPVSTLVDIDGSFGLHPALAPLQPLVAAGTLGFVHAAGMPRANRSHFAATKQIETASIASTLHTGWLDRVQTRRPSSAPFAALNLGGTGVPESFLGSQPELAMGSVRDFALSVGSSDRAGWSRALSTLHAVATPGVTTATAVTVGALDTAAALNATTYVPSNGAVYPTSSLGRALGETAMLIKRQVGARIITIDTGNWDMHSGLAPTGDPRRGWMWDQLGDVARSLAAFAQDLGTDMAGVTLVSLSEFGRRAIENASNGVDHGWGNVMFVLGAGVEGGRVHGRWPGLDRTQLADGDLAATTDYRTVLSDILTQRVGFSSNEIAAVFPGYSGPRTMGLTRART